jgi:uncharacterized protein (TIRG00374 family)
MRRILPGLVGAVLAALLLLWALRGVQLDEVMRHIREAHTAPLVITVILGTATFPLRMVRWRLLLRQENGDPYPFAPLWHAVAIGFMASNLLPFRAGELVRTFSIVRLAGPRFTTAFSSIAVERIFDGLAIVALFTLALLASDLPPDVRVGQVSVAHAAQVAGLGSLGALLVALLVVLFPLAAERLVRRVLPRGRFADRVMNLIEGLRQGLTVLRSPSRTVGVVLWSLALWLLNGAAFYVCFAAFDIPVGFLGALLLQGVLALGISVQFTPGFVGQFEAAIVAALALYEVPNALASSYAIAFHGATFVPIILLGAWSLARTPVALRDMRQPQA